MTHTLSDIGAPPAAPESPPPFPDPLPSTAGLTVLRRRGTVTDFDAGRISVAIAKAFLAVEGESAGRSSRLRALVVDLTDSVVGTLDRRYGADHAPGRPIDLEEIQDQVELALMRGGHAAVARAYILYREEHRRARAERADPATVVTGIPDAAGSFTVIGSDGSPAPLDTARLQAVVAEACAGLAGVDAAAVLAATRDNLYDRISAQEFGLAPIMAARSLVETEPDYSRVAARLLADTLRREALSFLAGAPDQSSAQQMTERYPEYFRRFVARGIELGQLDPVLGEFDLDVIGDALDGERDREFSFLGLQTLYDRYFLHHQGIKYELPQAFFMRVAMGLAIREIDREGRAIEFYRLLSSFDFMASTPTLFNAGTTRPQLSSCFLTTVDDDLDTIFQSIKHNALLAKYSGGLGNDWTPVRGIGAHIKGTNGLSSGVVPFLKIANDTAVAVNQGGKRKGAVCAYLETWHVDIEEFLDLRKNAGDDRRRTHDMNTANWVPDEFLRRVEADGQWTLFSPDEVPDLHDLVGQAFSARYAEYEAAADRGELRVHRRVRARRVVAQDADRAVRDRPPVDHLQRPLQPAVPATACRRGAQFEPVHRDHPEHQGRITRAGRNRGVQPGLGESRRARHLGRSGCRSAAAHGAHRGAHAGQRHRHQPLHDRPGPPVEPRASTDRVGAHGVCRLPAAARGAVRVGRRRRVRRHLDGTAVLLRDPGVVRAGRRARTVPVVHGIAVEPRGAADRFGADPCRRSRW